MSRLLPFPTRAFLPKQFRKKSSPDGKFCFLTFLHIWGRVSAAARAASLMSARFAIENDQKYDRPSRSNDLQNPQSPAPNLAKLHLRAPMGAIKTPAICARPYAFFNFQCSILNAQIGSASEGQDQLFHVLFELKPLVAAPLESLSFKNPCLFARRFPRFEFLR